MLSEMQTYKYAIVKAFSKEVCFLPEITCPINIDHFSFACRAVMQLGGALATNASLENVLSASQPPFSLKRHKKIVAITCIRVLSWYSAKMAIGLQKKNNIAQIVAPISHKCPIDYLFSVAQHTSSYLFRSDGVAMQFLKVYKVVGLKNWVAKCNSIHIKFPSANQITTSSASVLLNIIKNIFGAAIRYFSLAAQWGIAQIISCHMCELSCSIINNKKSIINQFYFIYKEKLRFASLNIFFKLHRCCVEFCANKLTKLFELNKITKYLLKNACARRGFLYNFKCLRFKKIKRAGQMYSPLGTTLTTNTILRSDYG